MNTGQHEFGEGEQVSPTHFASTEPDEFNENLVPNAGQTVGVAREGIGDWSKPEKMRLLIGLPVVYVALLLYGGLAAVVLFGVANIDIAKDVLAFIAVPGTLAGTVIGFFFGEKKAGD